MGFQQGFRINTNTASLDTYRSYTASQAGLERNIERLSSGLRINRAADDAAGLAISQRMNNQVRGMQQANRNVQQANNMLQTAEGGLNEISNILGRMRELAVQSASDGVNGDDRSSIDLEFQQLKSEITRISDATEYNNTKLLNGNVKSKLTTNTGHADHTIDSEADATLTVDSAQAGTYTITVAAGSGSGSKDVTISSTDGRSQTINTANDTLDASAGEVLDFTSLGVKLSTTNSSTDVTFSTDLNGKKFIVDAGANIQVGANNVALEDRIAFGISDHRANQGEGLNLTATDLTSLGKAQSAINELDTAIDKVNDSRGNIGALQNRFEFTSSNLMNSIQNNSASMSTIRDADFAVEAADLARNQILTQSGTAMLAQANSLSQNVLSLIR